jgi:type VI secretion system protein ImpF
MQPARAGGEARIRQSVLDRLTDFNLESQFDAPATYWDDARALRESLCRDINDLLNTRRSEKDIDPGYEHCNTSLLAYGLPDFGTVSVVDAAAQDRIRRSVERALRIFEPRLSRVAVSVTRAEDSRPVLRLRIEALVHVEEVAEPIVFDALLEGDSKQFSVAGAGYE